MAEAEAVVATENHHGVVKRAELVGAVVVIQHDTIITLP